METSKHNLAEYQLGYHLKIAPHHIESRLGRLIDPSEMEALSSAMSKLGDFMNCCNLYEICDKNFQSIKLYCEQLPTNFNANPREQANIFIEQSVQEINRLLLNYLSSFRTYLDHLTTRYSHLDRQGSTYLKDFKKITSTCYDTSFFYRFFYKLRNFVQHCGLPITYMHTSETLDKGLVRVTISTGFSRDHLLEGFDWGPIKNDLLKQPERLELLPCLETFVREVQNINLVVTSIEICIANEPWRSLNEIVNEVRVQCADGEPFIGRLVRTAIGKSEMQMISFPFHQMKKYNEKCLEVQRLIAERRDAG